MNNLRLLSFASLCYQRLYILFYIVTIIEQMSATMDCSGSPCIRGGPDLTWWQRFFQPTMGQGAQIFHRPD